MRRLRHFRFCAGYVDDQDVGVRLNVGLHRHAGAMLLKFSVVEVKAAGVIFGAGERG
jgi:hypothetical protein